MLRLARMAYARGCARIGAGEPCGRWCVMSRQTGVTSISLRLTRIPLGACRHTQWSALDPPHCKLNRKAVDHATTMPLAVLVVASPVDRTFGVARARTKTTVTS